MRSSSSGGEERLEASEAREARERRTTDELMMEIGAQSHMGMMEATARRQSLQWSMAMNGRWTGLSSVDEDEGCKGRWASSGMEI